MTVFARALAALAACLLLLTGVPARAADDRLTDAETHLRACMDDLRAPGVAYAVIRGDQVVRRGTWGVDGNGDPITARTPFLLGSTSKSFTALAVTQLARAGRITLDAPARTYLPWLRLGDEATARTVTVRQLLTHTSGLPPVSRTTLTDRYDSRPGGLARSVRDLAGLRPVDPPGTTYHYSDANYMILGALVEHVTGDTFGVYLRRHVFDPLAMTHSAATAAEARTAGVPPGHRYYFGRPRTHPAPFDTAGAPYGFLAASLEDLTHYAIAQLNDGRYAGTRVLDAEGTRQMHTGTADTGHGTYAFGWQNSTLEGTGIRAVWHAGATPDHFAHLVLVPDSDLAVVVLTNIYALPIDPALAAGAFNLVRILHGHDPEAATGDHTFTWLLAALLTVAAVLLALLVWSLATRTRRRPRTRRRATATTLGWLAGCGAAAAAAGWGVPAAWGAGLGKVQLWAPDIGHSILAVLILAGALALTRVVLGIHALRQCRTPVPDSSPWHRREPSTS